MFVGAIQVARFITSFWILAPPVFALNTVNPDFAKRFNYAGPSEEINFGDWISLLTLCFAPLVAHVVAGAPQPVYLTTRRPGWLDRICIYNPTSILWRYFAITDRRVRHKAWNAADMAASNAYFWTARGWDGSEEMMVKSRAFCTQVPSRHRTALLSSESFKTVVISLQGVQAIYALVGGLLAIEGLGNEVFSRTIALNSVFFPLAVFGLLRLFAALWLTDEYSYISHTDGLEIPFINKVDGEPASGASPALQGQTLMSMGLLQPSYGGPRTVFLPQSNWRAIALRLVYLVPLCGLLAITIFYTIPYGNIETTGSSNFTLTTYTLAIFYIIFLSSTILTFSIYFMAGKSTTSTVIPCVASTTYKIYTGFLVSMALVLIVVSGVQTRRTACGRYTTFASPYDQGICNGVPIQADGSYGPFGIVAYSQNNSNIANNSTTTSTTDLNTTNAEMQVVHLDGWCSGTLAQEYGVNEVALVNSSSTTD